MTYYTAVRALNVMSDLYESLQLGTGCKANNLHSITFFPFF